MKTILCLLLTSLSVFGQATIYNGTIYNYSTSATAVSGPSISSNPTSVTCITNTTTNFTITASGTAPLSYKWQTNSVDLADVAGYSGTTTATMWVSNVVIAQSNWAFRCIVTNLYGSATSTAAILTVTNGVAAPDCTTTLITNSVASDNWSSGSSSANYLGLFYTMSSNTTMCAFYLSDVKLQATTNYVASVWAVNVATNGLLTQLGTWSTTTNTASGSQQSLKWSFGSNISLTNGARYAFVVMKTDGSLMAGTEENHQGGDTDSSLYTGLWRSSDGASINLSSRDTKWALIGP